MNINKLMKRGRWAYRHRITPVVKVLRMAQRALYCCDIPFQTAIDDSVHFNHNGFGIVINHRAVIGGGSDIQHSVTIGELQANGGVPVIGRNVYVGARAILLGRIEIGDGAKIGAGAVVLCDVPEGAVAVGVPATILQGEL